MARKKIRRANEYMNYGFLLDKKMSQVYFSYRPNPPEDVGFVSSKEEHSIELTGTLIESDSKRAKKGMRAIITLYCQRNDSDYISLSLGRDRKAEVESEWKSYIFIIIHAPVAIFNSLLNVFINHREDVALIIKATEFFRASAEAKSWTIVSPAADWFSQAES